MIKDSLRTVTPQFSTRRMLKEYVDRLYIPAMK
jgi:starch phosphorylase